MMKVLGPPPSNVRYRRWMWNEDRNEMEIVVIGAPEEQVQSTKLLGDSKGVTPQSQLNKQADGDQYATSLEVEKNL